MSIKDAQARFLPSPSVCPGCGHPHLQSLARLEGNDRLWIAFCPSCRTVQELVTIPDWFLRGLPAPARAGEVH